MRKLLLAIALLVGVLTAVGPEARAQVQVSSTDVAITFTTERSKTTPGTGVDFWLKGGSVDAGVSFYRGFGAAANLTLEEANQVVPGVNVTKIAFMAGPRYTFHLPATRQSRFFAESLFGVAHSDDGLFPTSTGDINNSATSYSLQVGGGCDLSVKKSWAIRIFEADYVRTGFPNNGSDSQNHLRLAFGIAYHISAH
jgi:hypothetical protein